MVGLREPSIDRLSSHPVSAIQDPDARKGSPVPIAVRYESVADAYMSGLERFAAAGGDPSRVSSVASFFVSRIDSAVDQRIAEELDAPRDRDRRAKLKSLVGRVAIALFQRGQKAAFRLPIEIIEDLCHELVRILFVRAREV